MDTLSVPVATAEFVALDVETNGRAGVLCEMTEVGAVLVGGGELHERFESLVRVERPLSRGIERFTGITQAMVDRAPPPEEVLPHVAQLLDGRVLVAHSASFDAGVLRQGFERVGLAWPDPPTLCTLAMARRLAPLANDRKLAALAGSLGIDVNGVHRALVDAETCARIFCALFPKLCAAATSVAGAMELAGPRRRRRTRRATALTTDHRPLTTRPDMSDLPNDTGVYIFRDGHGKPL